jgi:hypothetical protein
MLKRLLVKRAKPLLLQQLICNTTLLSVVIALVFDEMQLHEAHTWQHSMWYSSLAMQQELNLWCKTESVLLLHLVCCTLSMPAPVAGQKMKDDSNSHWKLKAKR